MTRDGERVIEVLLLAAGLLAAFGLQLRSGSLLPSERSVVHMPTPISVQMLEDQRHAKTQSMNDPVGRLLMPRPFAPFGAQIEQAIRDAARHAPRRTARPC